MVDWKYLSDNWRNQGIGEVVEKFRSVGVEIVDTILTASALYHRAGIPVSLMIIEDVPVSKLLVVLLEYAEPKHAQQIAEMLLWDDPLIVQRESWIFVLLKRIGNAKIVPTLDQFTDRVASRHYPDTRNTTSFFEVRASPEQYRRGAIYCVEELIKTCSRPDDMSIVLDIEMHVQDTLARLQRDLAIIEPIEIDRIVKLLEHAADDLRQKAADTSRSTHRIQYRIETQPSWLR